MEDKRRKLPSIPPNYVTLLELQERWIKEQQRKQNKEQQLGPESEPEVKPQEQGGIGDLLEKSEVAVCLASNDSTDKKIDSEGLKKKKRKGRWTKRRGYEIEARAQAETGAAEDEKAVAGGEAHAPQTKEASVKSRNGRRLGKMSTDDVRERVKQEPETKPEPEGAVCLVSSQTTAKREVRKSKKNQGKGEWKKVKEKKDEEKVAEGETHAPKTSHEKEERAKSGDAVVADQTVEIEGRFEDMSISGKRERGNDKPARPKNGGYYRGGHRMFDNRRRREEGKPRNAGMIWVKKGDTSGSNAGEIQSSG